MKYKNDDDTLAYQKGFRDGLEIGIERNKYKRDTERLLYKRGYDAGVAEYCRKAHPEDETFDLESLDGDESFCFLNP